MAFILMFTYEIVDKMRISYATISRPIAGNCEVYTLRYM